MKKPIKIGVLSDSHLETRLHNEAIRYLVEQGAKYLLHAGDLELKEHLESLARTNLPYVCVYGNNDTQLISFCNEYSIYREPYYFKINDLKIKMMHTPYYMSADADIVISGHTHKFEAYRRGETLFVNPGEVCAREKALSESVMLEVSKESIDVIYHSRHLEASTWKSEKLIF